MGNIHFCQFEIFVIESAEIHYRENNQILCDTFDHNFKNTPVTYELHVGNIQKALFFIIRSDIILHPYFKEIKKWRLTHFAIKLFISFFQCMKMDKHIPRYAKRLTTSYETFQL